jgi:hypothetical protein
MGTIGIGEIAVIFAVIAIFKTISFISAITARIKKYFDI